MTDAELSLVRKAREGDRASFEELVRRTSRLVFARLYLETGDTHAAEDLLQETLLTAFRSLGGLLNPRTFRAWLLTIAQNVAIDAARREARKRRVPPGRGDASALQLVAGTAPGPDDEAGRRELRGRGLAVLRSLPEEYRLPLPRRYMRGRG